MKAKRTRCHINSPFYGPQGYTKRVRFFQQDVIKINEVLYSPLFIFNLRKHMSAVSSKQSATVEFDLIPHEQNPAYQVLSITTAGDQYAQVYENLEQIELVHKGTGAVKLINCKLDKLTTKGSVELIGCTVTKTAPAGGNVFCHDCPKLGHVKAMKGYDVCALRCPDAEVLEGDRVFLGVSGKVIAGIRSSDGHAYFAMGPEADYQSKDNQGPKSFERLGGVKVDGADYKRPEVEKADEKVEEQPKGDDGWENDPAFKARLQYLLGKLGTNSF